MPESEDIKELKKELRKLKPMDRLKKLKKLGEKRKTEIGEIEDLIKDSEKDLKTDEVAEEITPEQTEINITRLFEEDTSQLESTVRKRLKKKERNKVISLLNGHIAIIPGCRISPMPA